MKMLMLIAPSIVPRVSGRALHNPAATPAAHGTNTQHRGGGAQLSAQHGLKPNGGGGTQLLPPDANGLAPDFRH